jgi:hypothetical protein
MQLEKERLSREAAEKEAAIAQVIVSPQIICFLDFYVTLSWFSGL